jgi:hypothetical protein
MNTTKWTRAERLRRLRVLAKEARRVERVAPSCRAEVGTRTVPVQSNEVPVNPIADDDDLADFVEFGAAASDPTVTGPGMVVHLYLTGTPDGFGGYELTDVVTGWMGTDEHPPRLVGRHS